MDQQIGDAQLKIENSLVPKGPNVVRHLALPAEGHTPEWITEEMDKMDAEWEKHANWKGGKLSGAVYREYCLSVYLFDLGFVMGGMEKGRELEREDGRYVVEDR